MADDLRELLSKTTYRREDVIRFLDPSVPTWARFDPQLGYVHGNIVMKDGMNGSCASYHYEAGGQRQMLNGTGQPCRINTYGDSFTQCAQVSDGETWQEYLAAHLGEPIRNYGVGGYGVYQAYRRARRVEATTAATTYVILNIWDDDHVRSLDAARSIRIHGFDVDLGDRRYQMFHANPWDHVRFDQNEGRFVERSSFCPTPDALLELADPDHFFNAFKDDLIVRLHILCGGGCVQQIGDLESLAEAFEMKINLRNPERRSQHAIDLHLEYGLRATEFILDQMCSWIQAEGKKLLVLLTRQASNVIAAIEGRPRFDQRILDCLARHNVPVIDMLDIHLEDYRSYRITPSQYVDRFYNGHYSPCGNHFFAFAIKDTVVQWLESNPPAYCNDSVSVAQASARLA